MRHIILLVVLGLLLTGCDLLENLTPQQGAAPLTIGEQVTFSGEVVDTIDDCAFDGICAYIVDVDDSQYEVIWATGMIPCQGQMDNNINVGDTIEVSGEVEDSARVTICTSPNYSIRLAG